MRRGVIRIGDPLSSGGQVASACSHFKVDGKEMAGVGDACHCDRHGDVKIVEGIETFTFFGKKLALHGCKVSCGCTVISTTELMVVDTGGGGAAQENLPEPAPAARVETKHALALVEKNAQTKIDSLVRSVPVEVKRAIQKSLDASNSPTDDDKTGRFHEEGGQWGKGVGGNVLVYPAVPGKVSKPGDKEANVDSGEAVDQQGKINNLATTDGKWHIHPMGDGLNGKRGFLQEPSSGDLKRPADEFAPINIVVGAASRRVYFYDAKGVIGDVALSDFMKEVK